jgi:hypothetical protein
MPIANRSAFACSKEKHAIVIRAPPDFIPFWYFAVASYDVGVRRYHDKDAADMPPDGLFRTLDLYCAGDNPTQIKASIPTNLHRRVKT